MLTGFPACSGATFNRHHPAPEGLFISHHIAVSCVMMPFCKGVLGVSCHHWARGGLYAG